MAVFQDPPRAVGCHGTWHAKSAIQWPSRGLSQLGIPSVRSEVSSSTAFAFPFAVAWSPGKQVGKGKTFPVRPQVFHRSLHIVFQRGPLGRQCLGVIRGVWVQSTLRITSPMPWPSIDSNIFNLNDLICELFMNQVLKRMVDQLLMPASNLVPWPLTH